MANVDAVKDTLLELVTWPTRPVYEGDPLEGGRYKRLGQYHTIHVLRPSRAAEVGERVVCGIRIARASRWVVASVKAVINTSGVLGSFGPNEPYPVCKRCIAGLRRRKIEYPESRVVTLNLL